MDKDLEKKLIETKIAMLNTIKDVMKNYDKGLTTKNALQLSQAIALIEGDYIAGLEGPDV
jgi:hypothetical protein